MSTNRGIPFQSGPGISMANLAGQIIYRQHPSRPALSGRGTSETQYVLGNTLYGSASQNGDGTYGGSIGGAPLGDDVVKTDTWHRDKRPLTYADEITDSVEMVLARPYAEIPSYGTVTFRWFTREAIFDAHGQLVEITAETLALELQFSGGTTSIIVP